MIDGASMGFSASLVVSAVWMFLFRKIPSWKWFEAILGKSPQPFQKLWQGWTDCAYCGGFWVALLVRFVTGLRTIDFSQSVNLIVAWWLDAYATAIIVLFIIRVLDTLAVLSAKKKGESHADIH